jgi:cyclic pyranopterin phosphate synthase
MLIDTYGRQATDLRLTDDEIVGPITVAVTSLGIEEVRFTGGEPPLRPDLVGIVEQVAALAPRPKCP